MLHIRCWFFIGLRDPANRPPVPIPGGPYIIHVDQRELAPVSGKPYNHNNRPDSFRASKSVDLGAQPEKGIVKFGLYSVKIKA